MDSDISNKRINVIIYTYYDVTIFNVSKKMPLVCTLAEIFMELT